MVREPGILAVKHIGLLMIREENDILERTLAHNAEIVDCFYVLDGTVPNDESRAICEAHDKLAGYWTDHEAQCDLRFPDDPCDGYRQFLLERAYADHGHNHWFLLLHGDEIWTHDVRAFTQSTTSTATGFIYQLPFFFPRAGEKWEDEMHPIDQLHWHLGPGWPEVRMFRGGANVRYDVAQHFSVAPTGINQFDLVTNANILHYPYRSPEVQRARAREGFDPDNYQHVIDGDAVYWTDEMISDRMRNPRFSQFGSAILEAAAV